MYTRKAVVAGQFYNDSPKELRREVLSYLNKNSQIDKCSNIPKHPNNTCSSDNNEATNNLNALNNTEAIHDLACQGNNPSNSSSTDPKKQLGKINARMILLPHAGHIYCGSTIGKTLAQTILGKNIIMLCPNHRGLGERLAIWPKGEWLTPLGAVKINSNLAQNILDSHQSFQADTKAHELEHSIEVLLPFIQCYSPNSQIIPISVSIYNYQELDSIAQSLAKIISHANKQNDEISIIVSSDMNHFEDDKISAQKDALALTELINCRPESLLNVVVQNKISMCGVSPAVLGLSTCIHHKKCTVSIIEYTNSAKVNNNFSSVVGYCGAIIQ